MIEVNDKWYTNEEIAEIRKTNPNFGKDIRLAYTKKEWERLQKQADELIYDADGNIIMERVLYYLSFIPNTNKK